VYDFFLSKETFFNHNRAYLIATPILAFILPFIKIPTFQKVTTQELFVTLPEVLLSPQSVIEKTEIYNSINYISIIFYTGVSLFSLLFILKLTRILLLIFKNKAIKNGNYKLIVLPKSTNAFSFFHYIFLGSEIPKEQQNEIIQHEMIHSKQKHSIDLLLFELLRIVMWFNPIHYLYQKRITVLHEYISDNEVLKTKEKNAYFNTILSEAFSVENISFINQFYKKSLIKKRITMMTKRKSKNLNQLKYLLLVPVLTSMLIYTSCGVKKINQPTKIATEEVITTRADNVEPLNEIVVSTKENNQAVRVFLFENGASKIFYGKSLEYLLENEMKQSIKNKKINISFPEIKNGKFEKTKDVIVKIENHHVTNTYQPKDGEAVPYAIVEEAPIFPGCENSEHRSCFSQSVDQHVRRTFNSKLAKSLGLKPGKKRIFVMFKINEKGEIIDIQSRAPHPKLQEEAVRVIKTLPKMTPAKQRGKKVSIRYSLPIAFMVE